MFKKNYVMSNQSNQEDFGMGEYEVFGDKINFSQLITIQLRVVIYSLTYMNYGLFVNSVEALEILLWSYLPKTYQDTYEKSIQTIDERYKKIQPKERNEEILEFLKNKEKLKILTKVMKQNDLTPNSEIDTGDIGESDDDLE